MTPQQKTILEIVPKKEKFFPAKFVKQYRKFPNDYRKRLSEMKIKKWFVPLDEYEDGMRAWQITKEGIKQLAK